MKCPLCTKNVEPGGPHAPFCSDRCCLIDLGNWASGKYCISTPAESAPGDENDVHGGTEDTVPGFSGDENEGQDSEA